MKNKNREIKFRVWVASNLHYSSEMFITNDNGWGEPAICLNLDTNYIDDSGGCVFQQFTGLKDRQGKEIYEGDIVNTNGGNHIIEWRGAGFACTWSDYALDSCWFLGGGPVVVGNIFENAELADRARKGPTK
jgi:uncharacterized phage protein (TIGR01671 family)